MHQVICANHNRPEVEKRTLPGEAERDAETRQRPCAVFLLGAKSCDLIYPEAIRKKIAKYVDIASPPIFTESLNGETLDLRGIDILFTGWQAPIMDENFLQMAPDLKVVFYGAGSIRHCTTPAFWERDILITTANAANAVPVSEFTLAAIIFSMKRFWHYAALAKRGKGWGDNARPAQGNYHSTVGLISCGVISRQVIKRLHQFDLDVMVSCPFLRPEDAKHLGVSIASTEDVFQKSDVVSLHTPSMKETWGMIGREHFEIMKTHATFINTARGKVVREKELIEVAHVRHDLTFLLDVTDPEPPQVNSPLLTLPNVILTPHIAGSMGAEIGRLGECMFEELKRYLAGEPLRWEVTREAAAKMA